MKILMIGLFSACMLGMVSGCSMPGAASGTANPEPPAESVATEDEQCTPESFPFLQGDEKKLYAKVRRLPSRNIEENMAGYYKLWKMNPTNTFYKNKFFRYGSAFYRTNKRYVHPHFVTIEYRVANTKDVYLLNKPYGSRVLDVSRIPDQTLVRLIDYERVQHSDSVAEIWYLVEWCGKRGYVSEALTDSVFHPGMAKILWW